MCLHIICICHVKTSEISFWIFMVHYLNTSAEMTGSDLSITTCNSLRNIQHGWKCTVPTCTCNAAMIIKFLHVHHKHSGLYYSEKITVHSRVWRCSVSALYSCTCKKNKLNADIIINTAWKLNSWMSIWCHYTTLKYTPDSLSAEVADDTSSVRHSLFSQLIPGQSIVIRVPVLPTSVQQWDRNNAWGSLHAGCLQPP